MTVTAFDEFETEPTRSEEPKPQRRTDGIYGLPGVGGPASKVHEFFESMAPEPEDPLAVKVGKNLVRGGAVAAATGAALVVVF
ncbi:hypothetical protein ACU610_21385 [Geodermatophilus sp. URMC 61]|uniref:hypothetical protein n=1 Tax=Geodermatophilus sp. URMC 61 TaxID=3423411 RepID=UPI00406CD7BE